MTAREQIHLWASADLVVHVHGATQGSWQFLPGNATVVHIVQHPGGVIHDNQYADQWVRKDSAFRGRGKGGVVSWGGVCGGGD